MTKEEARVARIEAEEKVMHMMITLEYCLMRSWRNIMNEDEGLGNDEDRKRQRKRLWT